MEKSIKKTKMIKFTIFVLKIRTKKYLFVDNNFKFCREEKHHNSTSWYNQEEAYFVADLIDYILKNNDNSNISAKSIGVITPYNDQVAAIRKELEKEVYFNDIEIKSIDSFQGREKDIIIFSFVRTNLKSELAFLCDEDGYKRMNVMLTRAKKAFIFVGDWRKVLVNLNENKKEKSERKTNLWFEWYQMAKSNDCVVSYDDFGTCNPMQQNIFQKENLRQKNQLQDKENIPKYTKRINIKTGTKLLRIKILKLN